MITKEFAFKGVRLNGFLALFLLLIVLPLVTFFLLLFMVQSIPSFFIISILAALVFILGLCGLFSQEPNEARVMVLFGKYKGTFTNTGFFWVNPFLSRKKLSLRARNLNADPIKVNDKIGNPIMIGLVLVWKLKDTYKAMFEIDAQTMAAKADQIATVASRMRAFESFVRVQSDAALRQVAGEYAYDDSSVDSEEMTLRGGNKEINDQENRHIDNRIRNDPTERTGTNRLEAAINSRYRRPICNQISGTSADRLHSQRHNERMDTGICYNPAVCKSDQDAQCNTDPYPKPHRHIPYLKC